MSVLKYDRYASHLPYLYKALRHAGGPVLELGAGFYSTPLIQMHNAGGFSVEEDPQWAGVLRGLGYVILDKVPNKMRAANGKWGLVFVDSSPESKRVQQVMHLKGKTSMFLCHDSNPDWDHAYGYSKIIPQFRYHRQFTDLYPHTLYLSDLVDPNLIFG